MNREQQRLRRVVRVSTEDTLNFWKGIADVGLLGEVVTNISTELQELLNGVQQRREPASLQDTGTQHVLGLLGELRKERTNSPEADGE